MLHKLDGQPLKRVGKFPRKKSLLKKGRLFAESREMTLDEQNREDRKSNVKNLGDGETGPVNSEFN